ncbi:MAG: 3-deoxy-D-manno-octulosonic acid transferase [Akkermansiaceae bacterium]
MLFRTAILIYNLALPLLFLVAFPAWLIKMWKRGGYGTGLLERLAIFKGPASDRSKGGIYVHAVSVGETLIATKLLDALLEHSPNEKIILAATTATGHEVARKWAAPNNQVTVIYSPVDFPWVVRKTFKRFSPRQIVLIESEVWPNMLRVAKRMDMAIVMANARLSARSERRFLKLSAVVRPLYNMIDHVCVQSEIDAARFRNLGVLEEKIHLTGSIKFDPQNGTQPQKREEFQDIINDFGVSRPIILTASTHAGEEALIGKQIRESLPNALAVIVPRHAERRGEVVADLQSCGYTPILRTAYNTPSHPQDACLVIDTTGELRDWTAHADVVIIGKSWLGEGGQNPAEAIMAGVPLVCGPNMQNFEPLMTELRNAKGVKMLDSAGALPAALSELVGNTTLTKQITDSAKEVLASHSEAVEKTLQLLDL